MNGEVRLSQYEPSAPSTPKPSTVSRRSGPIKEKIEEQHAVIRSLEEQNALLANKCNLLIEDYSAQTVALHVLESENDRLKRDIEEKTNEQLGQFRHEFRTAELEWATKEKILLAQIDEQKLRLDDLLKKNTSAENTISALNKKIAEVDHQYDADSLNKIESGAAQNFTVDMIAANCSNSRSPQEDGRHDDIVAKMQTENTVLREEIAGLTQFINHLIAKIDKMIVDEAESPKEKLKLIKQGAPVIYSHAEWTAMERKGKSAAAVKDEIKLLDMKEISQTSTPAEPASEKKGVLSAITKTLSFWGKPSSSHSRKELSFAEVERSLAWIPSATFKRFRFGMQLSRASNARACC
ncbi:hypothetical protein HDU84_001178 [Entophlyctis sp. JEL0112]|nr:hypothetical protein HDU84_001178 [Entophlyctis sp. JEL0112]